MQPGFQRNSVEMWRLDLKPLIQPAPLHTVFSPRLWLDQACFRAFTLFPSATLSGSYCCFPYIWGELRSFSSECRWPFKLMFLRGHYIQELVGERLKMNKAWCFYLLHWLVWFPSLSVACELVLMVALDISESFFLWSIKVIAFSVMEFKW